MECEEYPVFGSGAFGEHMPAHAEKFFEGAFSYYRKYAAHKGDQINGSLCFRILVMASDLLF
jgi:hypothetical protein